LAESAFLQPTGSIKAVIAAYPGLDIVREYDRPILGLPTVPKSVLEEYLKAMVPGKIVTSAIPPERLAIGLSINQQHRKAEFFGTDERLYPFKVLEKLEIVPPFMLIIHGKDDSVIPVAESVRFYEMLKNKFGDDAVDLRIRPGEHGFDEKTDLDEEWLQEGLRRVAYLWLVSPVE
jgi:pimeloyl-ACP methyl ester carboxylesterase